MLNRLYNILEGSYSGNDNSTETQFMEILNTSTIAFNGLRHKSGNPGEQTLR